MYRGLKKVIFLAFIVIFGTILSTSVTFAASSSPTTDQSKIINQVNNTNQFISTAIVNTCNRADSSTATQDKLDATCSQLVKVTDQKVAALTNHASNFGVAIVSDYVPVTINGQTTLIDPCCAH